MQGHSNSSKQNLPSEVAFEDTSQCQAVPGALNLSSERQDLAGAEAGLMAPVCLSHMQLPANSYTSLLAQVCYL